MNFLARHLRASPLLLLCLTTRLSLFGQQHESCRVSHLNNTPETAEERAQLEQFEKELQRQMRIAAGRKRIEREYGGWADVTEDILHVRVVIHAMGTQSLLSRVTKQRVDGIINSLNDFFSGAKQQEALSTLPASVLSVAAGDTGIRFFLAKEAPPGKSFASETVGLVKHFYNKSVWTGPEMHAYADGLSWNRRKYVNFFIIEQSDGGIAGYAVRSQPYQAGWLFVMDFAGAVIAAHEMGHYLGLRHPWGTSGSEPNNSCREEYLDGISDTPPQLGPVYGCSTASVRQCGEHRAMLENIMGYGGCRSIFTQGQKTYMRTLLANEYYKPIYSKILHVNAFADAGGNGNSWSSALQDLESALTKARTSTSSQWVIEIAGGTYIPSQGSGREKTFLIDQDIHLLGGFSPDGRVQDPLKYRTILSGDLSSNDQIGLAHDASDNQGQSENAYHVLTLSTRGDVTLKNLTIEKGIANGTTEEQSHGGGIWMKHSATTLHMKNIILQHNQAHHKGGGMYLAGNGLDARMENITARYNQARQGGGSYLSEISSSGQLSLERGLWHHNKALNEGGGMYLNGQAVTVNVLVTHNQAEKGGGIYLKKELKMAQMSFFANHSPTHGAAVYLDATSSESTLLVNSLFHKNTGPSACYNAVTQGEGPQIAHSYFKTGEEALMGIADHRLRHQHITGGHHPGLVSENMEDGANFLRPLPNSILINRGEGSFIIGQNKFTRKDILSGFHRRGWFGRSSEIGACAYERGKRWYAKHDANTDTNTDGTSWASATSLSEAFKKVAYNEEIWLKHGVYDVTADAQSEAEKKQSTLLIRSRLRLYGGFSGTETERSQRNIRGYPVVLSGKNLAYHVVTVPERSEGVWLDGLVVTEGHANGAQDKQQRGAGMYIEGEAILVGVTLKENTAHSGAGMWIEGSAFVDKDCDIHHNIASGHGGGIGVSEQGRLHMLGSIVRHNQGHWGVGLYNTGAAILTSSQFRHNEAKENTRGSGIYNSGCLYMFSCALTSNGSDEAENIQGGGIYLTGNKPTKLLNLTLANNVVSAEGAGVYVDSSLSDDALLANCVFVNNTRGTEENNSAPNDLYNAKTQGIGFRLSHSFLSDVNLNLSGHENHVLRRTALLDGDPQLSLFLVPQTNSPLADSGSHELLKEAALSKRQAGGDLSGKVRIQNNRIDLGAREAGPATFALPALSKTLPTSITPAFYFFYPEKGLPGSSITIIGSHLAQRREDNFVTFGSARSIIKHLSKRHLLSAQVPRLSPGAYTLTVNTAGNIPTSHTLKYTILPPNPSVSLSHAAPAQGKHGTQVTLHGTLFSADLNENKVQFGDTDATVESVNEERTQLMVVVPELSPGEYVIRLTVGETSLTHNTPFMVPTPPPPTTPTFTSFEPTRGRAEQEILLTGSHFSAQLNENKARFGDTIATVKSVNEERTQLMVVVPELNPGEYVIRLTVGETSLTHDTPFTVPVPPPPPTPTFTSFHPSRGHPEQEIQLKGAHFSDRLNENKVRFGNINAIVKSINDGRTQLVVIVPELHVGEYTLQLTVGSIPLAHATKFVVSPPPVPTFTSFEPTSGASGTKVVLTGTEFSADPSENRVLFGYIEAKIESVNTERTALVVIVPELSAGAYTIRLNTSQTPLKHNIKFVVVTPPRSDAAVWATEKRLERPHPNPTRGMLWVGTSFSEGQLWNASGALKRQWRQSQTQLNLSDLTEGMYILRWKTPEGQQKQACIVKY